MSERIVELLERAGWAIEEVHIGIIRVDDDLALEEVKRWKSELRDAEELLEQVLIEIEPKE